MKFEYRCILKAVFGINCAGCGGTRMFLSLLKMDFYQAFRYNPLMFILFFCVLIYIGYNIVLKIGKREYYVPSNRILYFLAFVILLFTFFRNIPGFEFLLPTEV